MVIVSAIHVLPVRNGTGVYGVKILCSFLHANKEQIVKWLISIHRDSRVIPCIRTKIMLKVKNIPELIFYGAFPALTWFYQ